MDCRWKTERQLAAASVSDPLARAELRAALLPHVTEATRQLIRKRSIADVREKELIAVGMEPFDQVFNVYLKNGHQDEAQEGHFFEYYLWWMRQAIVAYLSAHPD